MHWNDRVLAILVFTMLVAPGIMATDSQPSAPVRLIIGFHSASVDHDVDDLLYGGRIVLTNPALRFVVVTTSDGPLTWGLAAQDPAVRVIAIDRAAYRMHGPDVPTVPDPLPPPAHRPDDPHYGQQYGPALMRLPEAWTDGTGNHTKGVCVVDTGVRSDHEDLQGNVVGGLDLIDPDSVLVDGHGHGTHVAGIIAARLDNAIGIAGTANVGLRMVRVYDDRIYDSHIATGIQWCADNGGDVISLSLGAEQGDPFTEDAVRYAQARGSLVVASAGNGRCSDCISTPARLPEVIAVGCVDEERAACTFLSDGPEMELTAPGVDILSTCADRVDAYCTMSGTSMSAPAVAGVAALVWAHRPDLSHCELRDVLRQTAKDLGADGRDPEYGHGLIDARAAIDRARTISHDPEACPVEPTIRWVSPGLGADLRGNMSFRMQVTGPHVPVSLELILDDEPFLTLEGPDEDDLFEGQFDFTVYGEEIRIVHLEAVATLEDGTTLSRWSNHTIDNTLRVNMVRPHQRIVHGEVPIRVLAESPLSQVDAVRFRERGTEWIDITDTYDGTAYHTIWNSTHVDERDPERYLDVEAWDASGRRWDFDLVEVDNRPEPTIAIVEPPRILDQNAVAAGPTTVVVRAESTAGGSFEVLLDINGRGWIEMEPHPDREDHYVYDWDTTNERAWSILTAQAIDSGGTADDQLPVRVLGIGTF